MRASNVAQGDVLSDLNTLRKTNDRLSRKVAQLEQELQNENALELASLDEPFEVELEHRWMDRNRHHRTSHHKVSKTWRELFAFIAPELIQHPNEATVSSRFSKFLMPDASGSVSLDRDNLLTIRTQFTALGLIQARYAQATNGQMGMFWTLTKPGHRLMMQFRTVKPSNG